jgi:hypothetical protein
MEMRKILMHGLPACTGTLFYLTALSGRIPSVRLTCETSTYGVRRFLCSADRASWYNSGK